MTVTTAWWVRFLLGFVLLHGVLAGLAEIDATGRFGLPILAGVLLTALAVERVLDGTGPVTFKLVTLPPAAMVTFSLALAAVSATVPLQRWRCPVTLPDMDPGVRR